jgi:hypothetical protein
LHLRKAERTPLQAGEPPRVEALAVAGGIQIEASEAPVFVWLEK